MKDNWPQITQMTQIFVLVLFMVGVVGAVTFDELIGSYSFDYDSGELVVGNISYSVVGDDLIFGFGVVGNGSYDFYVDVEDVNVVSGESEVDLVSGGFVSVSVKTFFLSGKNDFNCSLRIYDSSGALVYFEDFEINDLDYEIGFNVSGVDEVVNDSIFILVDVNSSVDVGLGVGLIFEIDGESFEVDDTFDFEIGENVVAFDVTDVLVEVRRNGVLNVSGIWIGERFVGLDYLTSSYDYEDFVSGNYLRDCYLAGVDEDEDGFFEGLRSTFEINIDFTGNYLAVGVAYVDGNFLYYPGANSVALSEGVFNFSYDVLGDRFYASGLEGEMKAFGVSLFDVDGDEIDSLKSCGVTNFSYLDFERPGLADLILNLSEAEGNIVVDVFNDGVDGAVGFEVKVWDEENDWSWDVGFLEANESLSFEIAGWGLGNLSGVVDYSGRVDEEDEENNFFVLAKFVESCVPEIAYGSWGDWVNVTDCVSGEVLQKRSRISSDANFCNGSLNVTYYESRVVDCFVEDDSNNQRKSRNSVSGKRVRHVFGYEYGDWGEWKDVSFCRENGTILQERERVSGEFVDLEFREVGCEISLNGVGETSSCDDKFGVCFDECNGFECLGCFFEDFVCRVKLS